MSAVYENLTQEGFNNLRLKDGIKNFVLKKSLEIRYIPDNFYFPQSLKSIYISGCKIKNIKKDIFKYLNNLENLTIKDCFIDIIILEIPQSLVELDLSYNCIEIFKINENNNLERLNLNYNNLYLLPESRTGIEIVDTVDNNMSNFDPCAMRRSLLFLEKVYKNNVDFLELIEREKERMEIYIKEDLLSKHGHKSDMTREEREKFNKMKKSKIKVSNNVHNSLINDEVTININKIYEKTKNYRKPFFDNIKSYKKYVLNKIKKIFYSGYYNKIMLTFQQDKFYEEIKYNIKNNLIRVISYEPYKEIYYTDLLDRILELSLTFEKNDFETFKVVLKTQVEDGRGFCTVGKFNRLTNSLLGFLNDMNPGIPTIDIINNKLNEIKKKYLYKYNEECIDYYLDSLTDFIKYIDSLNLNMDSRNGWIDALKLEYEYFKEEEEKRKKEEEKRKKEEEKKEEEEEEKKEEEEEEDLPPPYESLYTPSYNSSNYKKSNIVLREPSLPPHYY